MTIKLKRSASGWLANISGLGEVPLPFTAAAPLAMVKADIAARFPLATVTEG